MDLIRVIFVIVHFVCGWFRLFEDFSEGCIPWEPYALVLWIQDDCLEISDLSELFVCCCHQWCAPVLKTCLWTGQFFPMGISEEMKWEDPLTPENVRIHFSRQLTFVVFFHRLYFCPCFLTCDHLVSKFVYIFLRLLEKWEDKTGKLLHWKWRRFNKLLSGSSHFRRKFLRAWLTKVWGMSLMKPRLSSSAFT